MGGGPSGSVPGLRQSSAAVPTAANVKGGKVGKGAKGGHHSGTYHSAHQLKRKRKESSAKSQPIPVAPLEGSLAARVSQHISPSDDPLEGHSGGSFGGGQSSSVGSAPRASALDPSNHAPPTVSRLPLGRHHTSTAHSGKCNYVYYAPSSNHCPVSICSIVPYRRKQPGSGRPKQLKRPPTTPDRNVASKAGKAVTKAVGKMSAKTAKKTTLGKSYRGLLHPHTLAYDPSWLDDPRLTSGKHSTIMNLPGMRVSLFPYVRASELRQELNERFMRTHPGSTLTITKIRSLKKRLLLCGIDAHLDLAVVAVAYVCLEKLITYGYVTKESRKCDAAVCLLLATKFYHYSMAKAALLQLLEAVEKHLGASPRDVMAREMLVYTRLQFDISTRPEDIRPHYVRLQDQIRSTTDSVLVEYRHFAVHDFDLLASEQHGAFGHADSSTNAAHWGSSHDGAA